MRKRDNLRLFSLQQAAVGVWITAPKFCGLKLTAKSGRRQGLAYPVQQASHDLRKLRKFDPDDRTPSGIDTSGAMGSRASAPRYFASVDLGQSRDPTGIAVARVETLDARQRPMSA